MKLLNTYKKIQKNAKLPISREEKEHLFHNRVKDRISKN